MYGLRKTLFLIYAAFLSFIGMFASDMYLPTLNQIQGGFHTTEALVGLSVGIYMMGFAFAQLIYGALSDQIGRKLSLSLGLSVFGLGTFGCIYAQNIEIFLIFRLVQAVGVSAAFVLWQPMVIDLFEGEEVQRIFSLLVTLNAISPAVAPLVGGFLGNALGWQSVFWTLQAVTVLILLWTIFVYRESLSQESKSMSFSISGVMSSYVSLISNRSFVAFSFVIALAATLYFVYLAVIPFVLHNDGFSEKTIGLTFFPFALAFMAGAQVARKFHPKLGDIRIMEIGITASLIGSSGLLLVSILHPLQAWMLIGAFCIITFANGFIIPTGMAFLVQRHSDIAGASASAIGFLMSFVGFVSTAIASFLVKPIGIYAITLIIIIFCILMVFVFLVGKRSLGEKEDSVGVVNEGSY